MIRDGLGALGLLLAILIGGCADNSATDKNRPGGFYGGVSAGGVMR